MSEYIEKIKKEKQKIEEELEELSNKMHQLRIDFSKKCQKK